MTFSTKLEKLTVRPICSDLYRKFLSVFVLFWLTAGRYEIRHSIFYADIVKLQGLIFGSLSVSGWLMLMAGGILIAEIIAIVLVVFGLESTWKMIFSIIVSYVVSSIMYV